ncbi:MAG: biotin--[acetyl-CoA-carboxylase] ligase [Treponema sp.]|nr:biotin--[acetyl-CoA-carboxylase] ligase [Treponema sp.]
MINEKKLSTKALVLIELREKQKPVNGNALARTLGISRVAVWKAVQALTEAGYKIEVSKNGYFLDPKKDKDFLYPWEFGEKEPLFRHFGNTGSTMDRARELAITGAAAGTVITAEKQSAGRGRNGRTWISRQGGLFFTIIDRPTLPLADYILHSLVIQIAVARTVSSVCGKQAHIRWPNDIYISRRKIAGVITEISGEGDMINWLSTGVGVNINNYAVSGKSASCAEITGKPVSRREVLIRILDEIEKVKKRFSSGAVYAQGNRYLADEWNSMTDCIGVKAAILDQAASNDKQGRVLARGVFDGIDPAGRCILKTEGGRGNLYFNPGPVSMIYM